MNSGIFQRYFRSGGRNEKKHYCLEENPGKGARYDMSQVVAIYDASGAWKQNFVWGGSIDEIAALEQADILDYDSDGNVAEVTRSFYHRNVLRGSEVTLPPNRHKRLSNSKLRRRFVARVPLSPPQLVPGTDAA